MDKQLCPVWYKFDLGPMLRAPTHWLLSQFYEQESVSPSWTAPLQPVDQERPLL